MSTAPPPVRAEAPLALTMGEPAGIGGEIALKAWLRRREAALPPFLVIDDPRRLAAIARALELPVEIDSIADAAEAAAVFARALPVLPVDLPVPAIPGHADPANAGAVIAAIDRAVDLAMAGAAAAMVTNPIHKATLYDAGFRYPGHTEYIAARCHAAAPVMLLAIEGLRVVPATIHAALAQAIASLDTATIVTAARVTAAALRRDFAVPHPRLAVAGLNPHAGEGGALGREEIEIIAPAVARLREEGIDAVGPLPPDTMFHAGARSRYDAAICMYHDQALIPLKTLDFDHGVNVTLGLPIVRTSPDHGTAFNIAGRGAARPDSLIAALRLARSIADNRRAAEPEAGRRRA